MWHPHSLPWQKYFKIKQQIKKAFSVLPCVKVQVIFTCKNRIKDMFRVKDVLPKLWRSHVVYKINCETCNVSYIGKTINTIYERFHTGKNSAHLHPENEHSPLLRHIKANPDHVFDSNNVQIVDHASGDALFTQESLYINLEKPELNKNIGTRPLYLF